MRGVKGREGGGKKNERGEGEMGRDGEWQREKR